ncbi:MAG: hypothetical protein ACXAC7_11550 [Candidatus Hodarchaeales archaeon]
MSKIRFFHFGLIVVLASSISVVTFNPDFESTVLASTSSLEQFSIYSYSPENTTHYTDRLL